MPDDTKRIPRSIGGLFIISIVIGLLAGVFSWLFRLLIGLIHNLVFLGQLSPYYDANVHTAGPWLGWLIIFVPVLGGLIVVFLIKNFAPEAKGHGVPEVMNAIYHKQGVIPGNVSIIKALASAITIGTGGSLGREGPIVQISAAFSSVIGGLLKMPARQRNLLIACGASAGIAATFNAPLGGILFSIELLMVSINSQTILPVAISTVVAANLGHYLIGSDPAFAVPPVDVALVDGNAIITLLAIPLGAVIGLLALLFIKSIYFAEDFFDGLPLNAYQRHMLGTLLLGLVFYGLYVEAGHYYVQGVGYAIIEDVLWNIILDPWFLLLLVLAKLVATSLTIGSGGSGGIFSPSLFLGAVTGAGFGNVVAMMFPMLGLDPIIFVIAGMAAMVSGTTSAPLTAAIIVYEMTLDYGAVLPIMAAVSVAYAVRRHFSAADIYTLKLIRRGQLIPEGLTTDIKSHLLIENAMDKNIVFLHGDDKVSGKDGIVCVLENDQVINVIDLQTSYIREELPAKVFESRDFVILRAGITVAEAVQSMKNARTGMALISVTCSIDKASILGVTTSRHLIKVIADTARELR